MKNYCNAHNRVYMLIAHNITGMITGTGWACNEMTAGAAVSRQLNTKRRCHNKEHASTTVTRRDMAAILGGCWTRVTMARNAVRGETAA